jgi:hypothetical protein
MIEVFSDDGVACLSVTEMIFGLTQIFYFMEIFASQSIVH